MQKFNYTYNYANAYTFVILCAEFDVTRMHTNFFFFEAACTSRSVLVNRKYFTKLADPRLVAMLQFSAICGQQLSVLFCALGLGTDDATGLRVCKVNARP